MDRYVPEPRRRKRFAAAFMAMIFGVFGVHKFYLNNQGAGIFYIMLFMMSINLFGFPISALLGFIDAMKLFTMSEEEFDHKYNTRSVRTGQRYNRNRSRRTKQQPDFRRRRQAQQRAHSRGQVKAKTGVLRKENAYVKTGIKKYKDFDLDDAIIDFNKGLEIEPNSVALHFNIACAYSLVEQKDKAFEHISKAVENGLKDISKIDTHEDLAFVRIQKEYEEFKSNGYRLTHSIRAKTKTKEAREVRTDSNDLLQRLNKLAELRKRGLLSDKEFLMEKEKLMG